MKRFSIPPREERERHSHTMSAYFLSPKEPLDISIIFYIKNLFSLPVSDIMTNLAVSMITKTLTKQIIIK